ncbi:MAG: hypothetical protein ACLQPD_04390 [Desulfomonilaceae bacterium]
MNRNLGTFAGTIILSIMIFMVAVTSGWSADKVTVSVSAPEGDTEVCMLTTVKGTVSDAKLHVFVGILPYKANRIWIQPKPTVASTGKWGCGCYFGTQTEGIDQEFEIRAIATRNDKLYRRGQELNAPWPENPGIVAWSDPVVVKRKKCPDD